MKIGYYQFDIMFGQKEFNIKKIRKTLLENDFDLIILPELFTTGYLFSTRSEVQSYGENVPYGDTTLELIKLAKIKDAYIIGSIVEIDEDKVYNTAVIVGPFGYIGKYRKIHLTKFEKPLFDEGREINVFDIMGVTIGVEICYDCWFPEMSRILTQKGAQVIVHPANFGGPQSLEMIKMRSMENMVYTITSNRIGTERGKDFDATFRGCSQIVDPNGDILICSKDEEDVVLIHIEPQKALHKKNVMCEDLTRELEKYQVKINTKI